MDRGYIKLWRKAEDSVTFSRGPLRIGVFVTLLMKATWHKTFFRGKELKPGDCAFSVLKMAEELGLSRSMFNRILDEFIEDGVITKENVDNRFTVISIVNWDTYQHTDENSGQPADNCRTTVGQPADNQRTTDGTHSKKVRRKEGKKDSFLVADAPSEKTEKKPSPSVASDGKPSEAVASDGKQPLAKGALPGFENTVKAQKESPIPGSADEVWAYIQSKTSKCAAVNEMTRQEADRFYFHYEGVGWKYGKGLAVKKWKSVLATWALQGKKYSADRNARYGNSGRSRSFDDGIDWSTVL